jgi:hypothetical protein
MEKKYTDWIGLTNYFLETNEDEMVDVKSPHLLGRKFQHNRLKKAAEWCAQNYEGDFIEIGAHLGETTVHLCEVAKKYNRKVIVIDPWDAHVNGLEEKIEYLEDNAYEVFLENTKQYEGLLEVIKISSITEELHDKIKKRKLCFAYLDGCHTSRALHNDLTLTKHCSGIIAVDDINYFLWCNISRQHYSLWNTMSDFAVATNRIAIHYGKMAEGYIFLDNAFEQIYMQDWPRFGKKSPAEYSQISTIIDSVTSGPRLQAKTTYRFGPYQGKFSSQSTSLEWDTRSLLGRIDINTGRDVIRFYDFTKSEIDFD